MRAALAYAPRPGPLGSARPSVAAAFLMPLAVVAFAWGNPIVLAALGAAALALAAGSAALDALRGPLRFGAALAVTIVAVNGIVAQRGQTVLLRGWDLPVLGRIDVSAEALAEGGVLALRILVVLLIFALWSACVDPDRVLRAIRPYAARSALTATLIARLVPLAAADAARISSAAALRGPAAAPVGRVEIARRLIAGSLDRSVDVAATLELRGYGLDRPHRRRREPLDRAEVELALGGASALALTAAGLATGAAAFEAYPLVSVELGMGAVLIAAGLPAILAAPLVTGRQANRA